MSTKKNSQNNRRREAGRTQPPHRPARILLWVFVAGAILITGLTYLLARSPSSTTQVKTMPDQASTLPARGGPLTVGARPYEFSLENLDGETVTLSQFLGRSIVINFWATWCGPCRLEMPEIQAVYEANRENGLVVLALNQDERPAEVESYFQELGLGFLPLLDVGSATARNYGLANTLPSTVIIDPAGEIVAIHRGILTRAQLESYLLETAQ